MKDVVILDVGSSKLLVAQGHKTLSGMYCIVPDTFAKVEYDGYYEKQIVNPNAIFEDLSKLFAQSKFNRKIKSIYVSIPDSFIMVKKGVYLTRFPKEKVISNKNIDAMKEAANSFKDIEGYTVISSEAINYTLDETIDVLYPQGESATQIKGDFSYILADNNFIDLFTKCLKDLGFKDVVFVNASLSLATRYIAEEERLNGSLVCDIGYGASSLAFVKGDAIVDLKVDNFGYAELVYELSEVLGVYFEEAADMLPNVNLFLANVETATYPVYTDDGVKNYMVEDVNSFIKEKLNQLVNSINEKILSMEDKVPDNAVIYLSGGGITCIKGATQYVEQQLKRKLRVLVVDIASFDKPYYTSLFALLDIACDNMEARSFWNKLFD